MTETTEEPQTKPIEPVAVFQSEQGSEDDQPRIPTSETQDETDSPSHPSPVASPSTLGPTPFQTAYSGPAYSPSSSSSVAPPGKKEFKRRPNTEEAHWCCLNILFCFYFQFICRIAPIMDEDIYEVDSRDKAERKTREGTEVWVKLQERYLLEKKKYDEAKAISPLFVLLLFMNILMDSSLTICNQFFQNKNEGAKKAVIGTTTCFWCRDEEACVGMSVFLT